jgi:hypothetical protein
MLLWATTAASFLLSLDLVIAGVQIPVVDGVLGGVSTQRSTHDASAAARPLTIAATTPGKLRFKSDPGVCGMFLIASQ